MVVVVICKNIKVTMGSFTVKAIVVLHGDQKPVYLCFHGYIGVTLHSSLLTGSDQPNRL